MKLAIDHIEGSEFLVLNADDINNVDIQKLIKTGSNTVWKYLTKPITKAMTESMGER